MNFQPPQNVQDAHQQVLRSAIAGAVFVGEYHKQMRIMAEDGSVEQYQDKLQSMLAKALETEAITYADYEKPLRELTRIAGKHWNPALELPESNIAQSITRLDMVGWQVDNENMAKLPVIPDVGARAKRLKNQMLDIKTDTLTPYQRMVFNADMKATGAAVEKAAELKEATATGDSIKADPEAAVTPRNLPKLSIEFVDQSSLHAWVRSLANLWVLPENREQLNQIIDDAHQHQRVEEPNVQAMMGLWLEEFPWIPNQWAEDASRAVIGSVVSTRLETLEASAADTVRAIFDDNYEYQESRRKPKQATDETQRATLNSALDELSELLESVRRGTEITPDLNQKVYQVSNTIRAVQDQMGAAPDIHTLSNDNEKDGPGP